MSLRFKNMTNMAEWGNKWWHILASYNKRVLFLRAEWFLKVPIELKPWLFFTITLPFHFLFSCQFLPFRLLTSLSCVFVRDKKDLYYPDINIRCDLQSLLWGEVYLKVDEPIQFVLNIWWVILVRPSDSSIHVFDTTQYCQGKPR